MIGAYTQSFGYVSGGLILLSFLPYLRGIFKGQTKPERMSWFIWSILGGIAFFSQLAKGASHSLWMPGLQTIGDLLVFVLAIKYGIGGMQRRDIVALVAVTISLVLWYHTKEPAVALMLAIAIDGIGGILTIIKSYKLPTTEPVTAWILTALGGLFGTLAVGELDWVLLAFPLYIFAINAAIAFSIRLGARRLQHQA